MPDRPRVFVSYAHDSPEHTARVNRFATFLQQRHGLNVRWDKPADGPRLDWSLWATREVAAADFIIVVASPAYKRRAEGTESPGVGHGSKFEAALIRDRLTEDLDGETARVLPVMLPGGSIHDIPAWLNRHSTTRFEIHEISSDGVASILAAILGREPEPSAVRDGPVLVANGLRWRSHSSGVRAGSASIDGVRYGDSIVLRPGRASAELRGFVEVELGGAYERLRTVAGVLDDATETFQVGLFRVSVDGRQHVERRVALGLPAVIEVNVTGARTLRLEMYRPGAGITPLAANPRPGRLPELAWGDPTLF